MLSVDDASALILDRVSPVDTEQVDVITADGRVLARDEKAARAIPAFDNSAMDGVGVRANDAAAPGAQLRVVGEALPGGLPPREITAGECVRIMTGAPIPPGVEAVVMREHTDMAVAVPAVPAAVEASIRILEKATAGQNIRRRGEDVAESAVVARAADVVTPARMNALLAAGLVKIVVHRRPVVCVLASGDELREIGAPLEDASVPNSNAHAIAALLRALGCDVRLLGIAPDSLDGHVAAMRRALDADALVTIGGVSMGTHDFVKPALDKIGGTLEMWKVAMRPGKPIAFGRVSRETRASLPVFGLPGNPVSAHVAAELFLRPAIEKMRGARWSRRVSKARLEGAPFTKKAGLEHFARALVDGDSVRLLDKQGSHHIAALAQANALARFGADVERAEVGSLVDVVSLA